MFYDFNTGAHDALPAAYHGRAVPDHLPALAARGVRFEDAAVPYLVCSPSRAAIFTGLYPHQNGQMGLATHQFAMYRHWPVVPTFLHDRRYRTGLVGKLHVNPAAAFTFDFKRHNGSNFSDRDIRAFANAARAFFDEGDAPFFLMINYPDAHFPLHRQQHGWPINPQTGEDVEVMPWFLSLEDARDKIESWRDDYNTERPHSSLENMPPDEFVARHGPTVPATPPPPAHAELSCESTLSGCT